MPEAPMHKENPSAAREHQIRAAGQLAYVNSVSVSKSVKYAADDILWLRVLTLNGSHDLGALLRCKDVCHGLRLRDQEEDR